jgi:hypothetical protein
MLDQKQRSSSRPSLSLLFQEKNLWKKTKNKRMSFIFIGFGEPIAEKGSVLQILSVAVYNHYKRIYFESSRKGNAKQSNSGHGYFFFFFLFLRGLDIT